MKLIVCLLVFSVSCAAQIASGGNYALEKAVVAGGGGSSASGAYSTDGTTGQNIAGTQSSNGQYSIRSGFWTSFLAPTAAGVNVGGRVEDAGGNGIANAILELSGPSWSSPRTIRSSAFGYFNFEDVLVGEFYILLVRHKRYVFSPDTYAFNLVDERSDIVFRAE